MMQALSDTALTLAVLFLIGMAIYQAEYVSWKTDKCGCVGIISVGLSAAYLLKVLATGEHIHPAAGLLVIGFAVWLGCRKLNHKRYSHGPMGPTDKSPLGDA